VDELLDAPTVSISGEITERTRFHLPTILSGWRRVPRDIDDITTNLTALTEKPEGHMQ
jgi:hypothetical protein